MDPSNEHTTTFDTNYNNNIISTLDSINHTSFKADADQYAAEDAARLLLAMLEKPFERGWALAIETPLLETALQMSSCIGMWAN